MGSGEPWRRRPGDLPSATLQPRRHDRVPVSRAKRQRNPEGCPIAPELRGRVIKDKRVFEVGKKNFRTEVEFEDGLVVSAGTFPDITEAQLELARYPRDVALYREVPQSVFIRHPQ